ncbi:MAG: Occludin/ELL family protein [Cyanobacteriota bacterium]|nr:Occludin/ELL family protein [Cyanobacteriota bacterium]
MVAFPPRLFARLSNRRALWPGTPGTVASRWRRVGIAALWAGLPLGAAHVSAQTGPVLCTTTLEAPLVVPGQPLPERGGPREVTRCGVVGTVNDLVEQRYFSYRAPFARGVDISHQVTDLLGLAMGGGNGTRLMGFGFPDQAIIWDGSAVENTARFLMEQQVHLVPRRTADLSSPYTTSVRAEGNNGGSPSALSYPEAGLDPR